jgi:1-aminocyclopropane-1-carboxylate deaminase/D-cysteine desulfhydrase-like pyridoxal-dependent ACC family enzyme
VVPFLNKSSLQRVHDPLFDERKLNVYVLRDDLIHPFISGNKWRKLKYNLEEFRKSGKKYLVTFGGAYSNHVVATAAAGKEYGIHTIGIIRGPELNPDSNPALQFANRCGMKLVFVSREDYKRYRNNIFEIKFIPEFQTTISELFILPEGGANEFAVKGCKEITEDIPVNFDYVCCACGTGTTLAGIASSLTVTQTAIGIAVLKGAGFLNETIQQISKKKNYRIFHDYHFDGYAKTTDELNRFCQAFSQNSGIPVEPVYTGKLFYGIYDLIRNNFFAEGKTIVLVHTGGVIRYEKSPQISNPRNEIKLLNIQE